MRCWRSEAACTLHPGQSHAPVLRVQPARTGWRLTLRAQATKQSSQSKWQICFRWPAAAVGGCVRTCRLDDADLDGALLRELGERLFQAIPRLVCLRERERRPTRTYLDGHPWLRVCVRRHSRPPLLLPPQRRPALARMRAQAPACWFECHQAGFAMLKTLMCAAGHCGRRLAPAVAARLLGAAQVGWCKRWRPLQRVRFRGSKQVEVRKSTFGFYSPVPCHSCHESSSLLVVVQAGHWTTCVARRQAA